ncbi:MAG: RCC1-like domain-containing protein, partial [Limisphaerales bacterium]
MKRICILFHCFVSLSMFAAALPGQMTSWGLIAINAVEPGTKFKAISAGNGSSHCLALTTKGTVVGWGENDEGPVSIPTG